MAVFDALSTQWRVGMGGRYGLDYNALPVVFDLYDVEDRKEMFACIRVMEDAVLLQQAEGSE